MDFTPSPPKSDSVLNVELHCTWEGRTLLLQLVLYFFFKLFLKPFTKPLLSQLSRQNGWFSSNGSDFSFPFPPIVRHLWWIFSVFMDAAFITIHFPKAWQNPSPLKLNVPVFCAGSRSCRLMLWIYCLAWIWNMLLLYSSASMSLCGQIFYWMYFALLSEKSINKLSSQTILHCHGFRLAHGWPGKQPPLLKMSLTQSTVLCCWSGENVWRLMEKNDLKCHQVENFSSYSTYSRPTDWVVRAESQNYQQWLESPPPVLSFYILSILVLWGSNNHTIITAW